MGISFVAGSMLNSDLVRTTDLAFNGNLIYLDVAANTVGINTVAPTEALQVNGNVLADNLFSNSSISTSGNVTGGNLISLGIVSSTANIIGGNLVTGGLVDATGNVIGGNLVTVGTVDAVAGLIGNLSVTGNVLGNLSLSGNLIATESTANAYFNSIIIGTTTVTSGNITTDGDLGLNFSPTAGNLLLNTRYINNLADPIQNQDAATKAYVDSMAGNVTSIGNLSVTDTTISTVTANANIIIAPLGTGEFQISSTSGFVVPAGNTAQRPSPATNATLRFNTDTQSLEVYDSVEASWDSIVSDITNQIIVPDGSSTVYTLDKSTTAPSIIVSINGLVQIPGVSYAYTVSGNQITFSSIPETTDIIDIRFL